MEEEEEEKEQQQLLLVAVVVEEKGDGGGGGGLVEVVKDEEEEMRKWKVYTVCLIRVPEYLNSIGFLLLHFKHRPAHKAHFCGFDRRTPTAVNAGALSSLAAELALRYCVQPVALRTGGLARELASLEEGKSRINTV